jgi:hypothetical protein
MTGIVGKTPEQEREFDLADRYKYIKKQRIVLDYHTVRRIVMCLFDSAFQLKGQGLTFSHGTIGNEFLDLSKEIDDLVVDLEPRHKVLLIPEIVYTANEMRKAELIRDQTRLISTHQAFIGEIAQQLGCLGNTDSIVKQLNILLAKKGKKKS